jgi:hypothetical protein
MIKKRHLDFRLHRLTAGCRIAVSIVLLSGLLISFCTADKEGSGTENWKSLFNGKDLTGWKVKIRGYDLGDNWGDTFRVEDGVMKVSYDQYENFDEKFGHIFYEEKFSHYRFRMEYRFVGDQVPGGPGWAFRNSGIMFHCQSPESMRKDQSFPVCVEDQLLGGNGTDERSTANICTPGTHVVMGGELVTQHCITSSSETYHGDQWVSTEVEVHGGGMIKHIVNGEVVFEYEQPQLDDNDPDAQKLLEKGDKLLSEGYISLQAESHPVEFRNIEILILEE